MDLDAKRAIILEAGAAWRRRLPASANPYAEGGEAFEVWHTFYQMALCDELQNTLRGDLINSEYEASAY